MRWYPTTRTDAPPRYTRMLLWFPEVKRRNGMIEPAHTKVVEKGDDWGDFGEPGDGFTHWTDYSKLTDNDTGRNQ